MAAPAARYLSAMLAMNLVWEVALLVTRSWDWPVQGWGRVTIVATRLGLGYNVFSEWVNVDLRQSWTYAAAMPRLPPWGTGLAPVLQWLLLPPLAMLAVRSPALLLTH